MSIKDIEKSSAFTIPTATTIRFPITSEENAEESRPGSKYPLLSPVLTQTRRRRAVSTAKQKEPAVVARRNARERKRVKLVNDGFVRLRKHVPTDPKNKKLSKVKTLRSAIDYIRHLQHLLSQANKHQLHSESELDPAATSSTIEWITTDLVSSNNFTFSRHSESSVVSSDARSGIRISTRKTTPYNSISKFHNLKHRFCEYNFIFYNYILQMFFLENILIVTLACSRSFNERASRQTKFMYKSTSKFYR